MIFLRLFFEFFQVGLFSVGGGLATIPFLRSLGESTGWFTSGDLANMIAVSESTPGPMGVNMASYVGFTVGNAQSSLPAGALLGSVVATLGLVSPSILVILLVARFLRSFRQSRTVDAVFYGLRPASTGLILAAGMSVAQIALLTGEPWGGWETIAAFVNWKAVALAVAVFAALHEKHLKKIHPIAFIGLSALLGALFQF